MRIIDYPPPARPLDGFEDVAGWQDGHQISVPVRLLLSLALAAVAPSVAAAAGSANAASGSATLAAAKAALAGGKADDAGSYLAAIQALLANNPTTAQLPIPVTSRTLASQLNPASLPSGQPVLLSEPGHEGLFRRVTGDISAKFVGAPAGQSLYIAFASDAVPGKSGGLQRVVVAPLAFASWGGVVADGVVVHDGVTNQARLNWMVQHPELRGVWIDYNTAIGGSVFIGTGKHVTGPGRDMPVLRAVGFTGYNAYPGMMMLGTTSPSAPVGHIGYSAQPTSGVRVTNIWIDVAKTGALYGDDNARVHAICPQDAVNYIAQGNKITNVTGYATVAFGGRGVTFRDNDIENAQVYCEATNAVDGFLFENNRLLKGDGDVSTEALLHALAGARRGSFRSNRGEDGMIAVSGIYVVGNTDADIFAVLYDDNWLDLAVDSVGINLINQYPARRCEARVVGGSVKTRGVGVSSTNGKLRLTGTEVNATVTSLASTKSQVTLDNPTMILGEGIGPGTDKAVFIVDAASKIRLIAGKFISRGGNLNLVQIGSNCIVQGAPDFSEMPTLGMQPVGIGHEVTRTLPADDVSSTFGGAERVGSVTGVFGIKLVPGGVYEYRFDGEISVPHEGFALWIDGTGPGRLYGGKAYLQSSANDSTPALGGPLRTWQDGLDQTGKGNGLITGTTSAGQRHEFVYEGKMMSTGADAQAFFSAIWTNGPGGSLGGTNRTIYAGATLRVKQVA